MFLGGQIIFNNHGIRIYNSIPRNYALALAFCMHCTAVHATYRTRSARRAPNGRSGGEPPELFVRARARAKHQSDIDPPKGEASKII